MPAEYPADKQERSDLFWAFITAKYTSHLAHVAPLAAATAAPALFAPRGSGKNRLGKLPLPCAFPSLSRSFTAHPNVFRVAFIQNFN